MKSLLHLFIALLCLLTIEFSAQDRYPELAYDANYKTIYKDSLGKQIGESYDRAEFFMEGIAVVGKMSGDEQLSAVIDNKGKYLIPFAPQYIRNLGSGLVRVEKENRHNSIMNKSGQTLYSCVACEITVLNDLKMLLAHPYGQYEGNDRAMKVTLMDYNGKIQFETKGQHAERILHNKNLAPQTYTQVPTNYFTVTNIDPQNRFCNMVLDTKGKVYADSVDQLFFIDGLAAFQKEKSSALVDSNMKILIPFEAGYQWMQVLQDHPAKGIAVRKNNLNGVVTPGNKTIVPLTSKFFINYKPFEKQYEIQNANGDSLYLLTLSLDTIISPYITIAPGKYPPELEGPVIYKLKGQAFNKYGFRDAKGKIKIPFVFDYLSQARHDSLLYFIGDSAGFISTTGKRLFKFPVPCSGAGWFSDMPAFCLLSKAGTSIDPTSNFQPQLNYAWVGRDGKICGGTTFSSAGPFVNGRCMVQKNKEWFFIDSLFQRIRFNEKYDFASYYGNDYAVIGNQKLFGLAHKSGKVIVPVEYETIATAPVGSYYDMQNSRVKPALYIDREGNEISAPGMIYIPDLQDGKIQVSQAGNRYFFDVSDPAAKPLSDSLAQWYTVNPVFKSDDEETDVIPLSTSKGHMITLKKGDGFSLVDKTTGKSFGERVYFAIKELNEYGAIAATGGTFTFINDQGRVLLDGYDEISWDHGLLHAKKYGAFAKGLPEGNSACYKSEYFDKNGKKKFEQTWHDHVPFRDDTLAFFRFGRTMSIVGLSGKVYVKERLIEGKPFRGICQNSLVYAAERNDTTYWDVLNLKKQKLYSLPLVSASMMIGPYRLNDTLYGYYSQDAVKHFVNRRGAELPYISEPTELSEDENWGSYFAQTEMVVKNTSSSRYGLMARDGHFVLPCSYKFLSKFHNGFALCSDSTEKLKIIDHKGSVRISYIPSESLYMVDLTRQPVTFYEGLFVNQARQMPLQMSGNDEEEGDAVTYYYSDTAGKVVLSLPSKYYIAGNFSEGLAPVINKKGQLGFIDKKGFEVIPCKLDYDPRSGPLPAFKGGYAYVYQYSGYIDKKGKYYFDVSQD